MKSTKLILLIGALLLFFRINCSYAQSECALYSKIIDSVYKRTTLLRYYVNMPEKVDPTNLPKEFFDTTTAILEAPYFIILNEDIFPLVDYQGREAIEAVKKYSKIGNLKFIQTETEDLKNCDFDNLSISYQKYKKSRDTVDFHAKATCTYKGSKLDVEKRLFEFSRFLKSSDGNFLVCQLYVTEYSYPGRQSMWSIVSHKNKNVWNIERLEIMFVR